MFVPYIPFSHALGFWAIFRPLFNHFRSFQTNIYRKNANFRGFEPGLSEFKAISVTTKPPRTHIVRLFFTLWNFDKPLRWKYLIKLVKNLAFSWRIGVNNGDWRVIIPMEASAVSLQLPTTAQCSRQAASFPRIRVSSPNNCVKNGPFPASFSLFSSFQNNWQ